MSKAQLKTLGFYLTCFLFAAFFIDLVKLYDWTIIHTFQIRDLSRAKLLIEGTPIFFGPEMTGGGNLPGPFYYLLLALVSLFEPQWWAALILLMVLTLGAAVIGAIYFRNQTSKLAGLYFLILFSTIPFTFRFAQWYLNVSYALPFAVACVICVLRAFQPGENRDKYLYAACLLTGLSIQLHFSGITVFVTVVILQLLGRRLGLKRFESRVFRNAVFLFFLPLIPYIIWDVCRRAGINFGQAPFHSGLPEAAMGRIASIANIMLAGSALPSIKVALSRIFQIFPWTLPILLALYFSKSAKAKPIYGSKILLVYIAISAVPAFDWLLSTQASRYTMHLYISLIFLTVFIHQRLVESPRLARLNWLLGMLALGLGGLFGFNYYTSFRTGDNLWRIGYYSLALWLLAVTYILVDKKQKRAAVISFALALQAIIFQRAIIDSPFYPKSWAQITRLSDWSSFWSGVYARTGWSYDEAINRIYFINEKFDMDSKPIFEMVKDQVKPKVARADIDGLFVSRIFEGGDIISWIKRQKVPDAIKAALDDGSIVLETDKARPGWLIVGYKSVRTTNLPRFFKSSGHGYIYTDDELRLNRVPGSDAVARDGNQFIFKWNECRTQHPFCSTGVLLDLGPKQVNLKVVGSAISQISPWISPDWTQAWIRPYIRFHCNGSAETYQIAPSVGFLREYSASNVEKLLISNNSILAPLERQFDIPCKNLIAIEIGREGSNVESIDRVSTLQPKSLVIRVQP